METINTQTPLHAIAEVIRADWKNLSPYAEPYVTAMESMDSVHKDYYHDSGKSIVMYFLANAQQWRGPVARSIKKTLNQMLTEGK